MKQSDFKIHRVIFWPIKSADFGAIESLTAQVYKSPSSCCSNECGGSLGTRNGGRGVVVSFSPSFNQQLTAFTIFHVDQPWAGPQSQQKSGQVEEQFLSRCQKNCLQLSRPKLGKLRFSSTFLDTFRHHTSRRMRLHQLVGGSTGSGYSLFRFHKQGKKLSLLKRNIFHPG